MRGGAKFELVGVSGLIVRWRLGDGAKLTLLANLGEGSVEGVLRFTGTAFYCNQHGLSAIFAAGRMPPWCAAWFIEEVRT
jgi:1,4-alpha-glucan branching enzyme/maltooligosyltrehalose trehalohydrolase